jgi:hypothetical protein
VPNLHSTTTPLTPQRTPPINPTSRRFPGHIQPHALHPMQQRENSLMDSSDHSDQQKISRPHTATSAQPSATTQESLTHSSDLSDQQKISGPQGPQREELAHSRTSPVRHDQQKISPRRQKLQRQSPALLTPTGSALFGLSSATAHVATLSGFGPQSLVTMSKLQSDVLREAISQIVAESSYRNIVETLTTAMHLCA